MRLDRHKFSSWLRTKHTQEIVGENRDCCGCPLALFYHESGAGEIAIFDDGRGYVIDRGYSKRSAPAWAAAFVFEVDDEQIPDGKITAQRALEILSKLS